MRRSIPTESKIIAEMIKREMNKEQFTLSNLVGLISKQRGKDIVFLEMIVHHAYLGLCLSFKNSDVVIITPGLPRSLALSTMVHELIHVYRGDAKTIDEDYTELTRELILSFVPSYKTVTYEDMPPERREIEDIVNGVAALLLRNINDDGYVPSDVRNMYGDTV